MQQKLFRIEQMFDERHAHVPARAAHAHAHDGDALAALKRELAHMRENFARNTRELSALLTEGKNRRLARAAGELGAAVDAMEKATDKILQSAEAIDDYAKALGVAPMTDYERSLAHDIQEHVVRIYEACNFQDLTGQRIGKVIGTLELVEERLSEVVERNKHPAGPVAPAAQAPGRGLINGPRLDGDSGHASQYDIDAMFG